MGLFSRRFDRNKFDFDDSHLNVPDTAISQQQSSSSSSFSNPAPTPKRKHGYSIEDAIKLMRELPKDQQEMVVNIVQKTLTSANINVTDIIDDAGRKLSRLETRSKQLHKEIEELEAGIAQRRKEITTINEDVKETQAVKVSFEQSLGKKTSHTAATASPVPPPPEVATAEASSETKVPDPKTKKTPAPPVAS